MRIEKAQNGYFVETIHGTWVYKDFEGVIAFLRADWRLGAGR